MLHITTNKSTKLCLNNHVLQTLFFPSDCNIRNCNKVLYEATFSNTENGTLLVLKFTFH